MMTTVEQCDPSEAPTGFVAVLKSTAKLGLDGANICRACDWRKQCNDETTDLLAYGHRCMSYHVIAFRDGKTYQRADGASVVFKKATADRVVSPGLEE